MVFIGLFLLLFVGGVYLWWRFREISNKQLFFRSSLFRSSAGCVMILIVAIIIVNLYSPERSQVIFPDDEARVQSENVVVDTVRRVVRNVNPARHYYFITENVTKRYTAGFFILQEFYTDCILNDSVGKLPLAYFGMGVIALKQGDYDKALRNLSSAPDKDFPFLNYALGEAYAHKGDTVSAEKYFLREMDTHDGNYTGAVRKLLRVYLQQSRWDAINDLYGRENASEHFPDDVVRAVHLYNWNFLRYLYWFWASIVNSTTLIGFIAALVISVVWIVYLYTLNVFGAQRLRPIVIMFFSGVLSMVIISIFVDLRVIHNLWESNGNLINDLLYYFVMVGIPEEFTKIFPILVMLLFIRKPVEPISYIIFAAASALGFAFIENLSYFEDISRGIIHGRAYLTAMGHMVFTSFAVYGVILYRFRKKKKYGEGMYLLMGFFFAAFLHGLFDTLLVFNLTFIFAFYFIFMIQMWIIAVNNCLNNSPTFNYYGIARIEKTRLYLPLALIAIFAMEYLEAGFSGGSVYANRSLYANLPLASGIIIFFSSNLSSFNLIKGYWRDVYFSSREKRGYGTLQPRSVLTSMYFLNAIQPQNYVGLRVLLFNDTYNKALAPFMEHAFEGKIVNRVILFEGKDQDPHWFILKLDQSLSIPDAHPQYFLVKLRYESESLLYLSEVDVFFRVIPDLEALKKGGRQKQAFPFYGWAHLTLIIEEEKSAQT